MININFTSIYSLQKPISEEKYDISVFNMNMDLIDSILNRIEKKNESQDELLASNESLNEHINDKENPHKVTKSQIGLENVDNTSDDTKPVSIAQQEAIDEAYTNANAYTDQKYEGVVQKPSILNTSEQISANTSSDNIAGALALKEINDTLDNKISQINSDLSKLDFSNALYITGDIDDKISDITFLKQHPLIFGHSSELSTLMSGGYWYFVISVVALTYSSQIAIGLFGAATHFCDPENGWGAWRKL